MKKIVIVSLFVCFATIVGKPSLACSQPRPQAALPVPDHIIVVIMENHNYADIIGSAEAPHINALANGDHSALFTNYHAIEHPSQPNYLDLYAGCNQGITDDSKPTNLPFTTDNLGRQLIAAGKTFVTYSEDLPSVGYDGYGTATYARKHNPSANWMGTGTNQIPPTTNQPFTAFPNDYTKLPTVSFVVPNLINDMHDGTIQQGDNWIEKNITPLVTWAKTHNSLVVITWDEDEGTIGGAIVTIFAGQMVKAGHYSETLNHYSTLRTIEDMYGLPHACNAADASAILDVWMSAGVALEPRESALNALSIYPNPTSGIFILSRIPNNAISLCVLNVLGEIVLEQKVDRANSISLDISDQPSGVYFARLTTPGFVSTRRIVRQ